MGDIFAKAPHFVTPVTLCGIAELMTTPTLATQPGGDSAPELPELQDTASFATDADTAQRLYGIDFESFGLRQKNSWDRQERFLIAYAATGVIGDGARAAGVTYEASEYWRNKDTLRFKARFEVAQKKFATNVLEKTMFERIADPSGNRGSDILLMFAMKAHKPEKYREDSRPIDDSAKAVLSKLMGWERNGKGSH